MKKIIILLICLFISVLLKADPKIELHFLNAKLAYINSDFETASKECQKAIALKEISFEDAESFLNLINYVNQFVSDQLSVAETDYNEKEYIKCIQVLSKALKKDSENLKIKNLYKTVILNLSEKEKKDLLDQLNNDIDINNKINNNAFLIALYTEKLLIDDTDQKAKLNLQRLRLLYKSKQTEIEVNRMINDLQKLLEQKGFEISKAELIVDDILYISPQNDRALSLKKIIEDYKIAALNAQNKALSSKKDSTTDLTKNKETLIAAIKQSIKSEHPVITKKSKFQIVRETNVQINNQNNIKMIGNIKLQKIQSNMIENRQKENSAEIHFNLALNRYKQKLFNEAKVEFLLTKLYNPEMQGLDEYINKCDQEKKNEDNQKKQEIKKDIQQSKIFVSQQKTEKAINIVYNTLLKQDIENKEAETYLKKIINNNIIENKIDINKYSSYYDLLNYFKNKGISFFNQKNYKQSISYWEDILILFPENETAKNYWIKNIQLMDRPSIYIKEIYNRGISYYSSGDYNKALFYFDLIDTALKNIRQKVALKNFELLYTKCQDYVNKNDMKKNQLSYIHNAALLDFVTGNYNAALTKWEYIIKIEPDNIKAQLNASKV